MSGPIVPVTIALGANLGARAASLEAAVQALREHPQIQVLAVSRWHETEPVGGPPNQPRYLNGVLLATTSLSARELLAQLQAIEERAGRQRSVPNAARTLDLDLIFYGTHNEDSPELCLPHPRAEERLFVLEPLAELDPLRRLPSCGLTVRERVEQLRERCSA